MAANDEQAPANEPEAPAAEGDAPPAADAPPAEAPAPSDDAAPAASGDDDAVEMAESVEADSFQLAAKCLGLFVILAIVYFWNWYCVQVVVPKVAVKFAKEQIELSTHQNNFIKAAEAMQANRWLGMAPVGLLVLLGLASIATRAWDVFSGIYFTLVVALFLLFLYGWLVFAVPLIQLQRNVPPAPAGTGSGSTPIAVTK